MKRLLLLALAAVLAPGPASAAHPRGDPPGDTGLWDDDWLNDELRRYVYLWTDPGGPEGPSFNNGSAYDCAPATTGLLASVDHDRDQLAGGGTRPWDLLGNPLPVPYVAPGCLVLDVRAGHVPTPDASPCDGVGLLAADHGAQPPAAPPGDAPAGAGKLVRTRCSSAAAPASPSALGPKVLGDDGMGVHATYNLSTGEYFVGWEFPALWAHAGALPSSVEGKTGYGIQFDCIDCPPPWGP